MFVGESTYPFALIERMSFSATPSSSTSPLLNVQFQNSPRPLTLLDLLMLCWQRRWLCGGTALAVSLAVVLGTFRIVPLYEAAARLGVDRGRKAVEFQVDPDSGRVEFGQLNTLREMLLSRPVLEGAMRNGGLAAAPAYVEAEEPLEILAKRVSVATSRDSYVLTVTLRDESPDTATRGLQALVDAFLANQGDRQGDRSRGALTFLQDQVVAERARLDKARAEEQVYRDKHGILSTDPEENLAAKSLADLQGQRVHLEGELARSTALLAQVDSAVAQKDPQALLRIEDISRHPVVVELQQSLYDLRDRSTQLAQKYKPKHPRMVEIHQQMIDKSNALTEAIDMAKQSLQTSHQQTIGQANALTQAANLAEAKLALYRSDLIRLKALTDEVTSRDVLLQQLQTRLNQEAVASHLEAKGVMVIDPPLTKRQPVNIRKSLFALAALVAGAVAGVVAVLGANALDRRIRGALQAQETANLPLLGHLPLELALRNRRGKLAEPGNHLAEAVRGLRASLTLARRSEGSQVLVMTSSASGEGKSTVCALLAASLVDGGRRVLLIDADMRRPTQHQLHEVTNERGLSFLLVGEAGISPVSIRPGLDLLPCGVLPPNPAELILRPTFASLLTEMRKLYDVVLIDCPPLGPVTDALLCAEHADGVLLVVRDRETLRTGLRRAVERMSPVHEKLLGLVLNAELQSVDGYGYGYGYGYAPYTSKSQSASSTTPTSAS